MAERMKPVLTSKGQIIYSFGQHPIDVYFILEGCVNVLDQYNQLYKTFHKGTYFGEIEIFLCKTRKDTVQAAGEQTTILKLPAVEFLKVLDQYPSIREEFVKIAQKRYQVDKDQRIQLKEIRYKLKYLKRKNAFLPNHEMRKSDFRLSEIKRAYSRVKSTIQTGLYHIYEKLQQKNREKKLGKNK